jgi:hypothetical protein
MENQINPAHISGFAEIWAQNDVLKGTGTLLHEIYLCDSFHQKSSKLDTFAAQGLLALDQSLCQYFDAFLNKKTLIYSRCSSCNNVPVSLNF